LAMKNIILSFVLVLSGCSVATDIYESQKIKKENEAIQVKNRELFQEYQACLVEYDAYATIALLSQKNIKKRIGSGFDKYGNFQPGFWIYTSVNMASNSVEIATSEDIVILPLKNGSKSVSKSKKMGAFFSDTGDFNVVYFYTDEFNCLGREHFGEVKLVSKKWLEEL
ncbi:hypothetical protein, partial [Vibrio cholerae]